MPWVREATGRYCNLRRCAHIPSYVLAEAQGNEFSNFSNFSNGCVIKSEIFAVGSRDEWYSMIVTIIGIGNATYKAPLTSTLLTARIVLELVYIEFGTDPSPSDCQQLAGRGSSPVGRHRLLATRRFAACRRAGATLRSLAWTSDDLSPSSFTLPELEV
jgi:hypothetical protein